MKRRTEISSAIKAARIASGMSQLQLAKLSRLPRTAIANYETRVIPPLVKLEQIAKALKINAAVLLVNGRAPTSHKRR